MLFLYHIVFFQSLPAHFLWFKPVSLFLTINFLLIFCTIGIKSTFTSKKFLTRWNHFPLIFHFYLHIFFLFVVQSLWNTSSSLYKPFRFCFCLKYTNLHYFHSYWLIRVFCHMSYQCFRVFGSAALFVYLLLYQWFLCIA